MISILRASASTNFLIAFKLTHLYKTKTVVNNHVNFSRRHQWDLMAYKLFVLKILNFSIDLNSLTCIDQDYHYALRVGIYSKNFSLKGCRRLSCWTNLHVQQEPGQFPEAAFIHKHKSVQVTPVLRFLQIPAILHNPVILILFSSIQWMLLFFL